ncbi:MAG: hypothetical protein HQK83_13135 [Fibrobacteria bacterium]|nr:hypothetical protein [Fibrobacteria bacterium]
MKRINFVYLWIMVMTSVYADLPKEKMMMLAIDKFDPVSSKKEPDFYTLSFEELNAAGVNGILIANNWGGNETYSNWEMVQEAHEYGFWVAAGPALHTGWDNAVIDFQRHALANMDFLEFDEPFDWNTCENWDHVFDVNDATVGELKAIGKSINPEMAVVMTDVNCNHVVENWANIDGLFNEVYIDAWYQKNIPLMVEYDKRFPNRFNGLWVYLLELSDYFERWNTDAQFETWLTDSYTKLNNVILFLFNNRATAEEGVSNGTNWDGRRVIIRRVTGGGPALPVWQGFTQSQDKTGAQDFQVQVKSEFGLDTSTAQCYYAVEQNQFGNTKWVRHYGITVTSPSGAKGPVTINASRVPIEMTGIGTAYTGPRVRFKIKDQYSGNYLRNARNTKKDFPVTISGKAWTNFSGLVSVDVLQPDFTINVQSDAGLDVASIVCEYSTDGGKSWKEHPATCSGSAGSKVLETVTVTQVPFVEDKPRTNKIRFTVTAGGNELKSEEYSVKIVLPPLFSGFELSRTGETVDFTVNVRDFDGIRVGSQKPAVQEGTIAHYPLDGTGDDVSGNGYGMVAKNGAGFSASDSWKTEEQAACFDGVNDFMDAGRIPLGRTQALTISAWVKAQDVEGRNSFLAAGGPEGRGSVLMEILASKQAYVSHRFISERADLGLVSPENSVTFNAWHHIAFTFDGDSVGKLYIDGNLVVSNSTTDDAAEKFGVYDLRPLRLGVNSNRAWFFKGCIDEVQVLDRALSEQEIASNYFSGMYRFTTDGGETWSKWNKLTTNIADGATTKGSMSVTDIPMPVGADSANRIELTARDIHGNAARQQYVLLSNDAVHIGNQPVFTGDMHFAPNPFYSETTASFVLDNPARVDFILYDGSGKKVKTIAAGLYKAGKHVFTWDGNGENGVRLPLGGYFARIRVGNTVIVKHLVKMD